VSAYLFIHFSDIHFGQERGGTIVTHNDARDRLVEDVARILMGNRAFGIIVTGDIAYSGQKKEYDAAGEWLDRIAKQAGCDPTSVHVVPGNHDIDLNEVTEGARDMLEKVATLGEEKLDRYLETTADRELLYKRFANYRDFAAGYGCHLDDEGGHAGEKDPIELAPGRRLAFLGLNSALICAGRDQQGRLLLGQRQRTIAITPGIERVVLLHHPLHWLQDHSDALSFIRNRARLLLTGHEHTPAVSVEEIDDGHHFMKIEAGATTPPNASSGFKYTYNILSFSWAEANDALEVVVQPRVWLDDTKQFIADTNRLGGRETKRFELGCPQFRAAPRHAPPSPRPLSKAATPTGADESESKELAVETTDPFPTLRLQFFRRLNRVQRLRVLIELGGLPESDVYPTMGIERQALEFIRRSGKIDDLRAAIDRATAPSITGKESPR
jgi:hypothetical protein